MKYAVLKIHDIDSFNDAQLQQISLKSLKYEGNKKDIFEFCPFLSNEKYIKCLQFFQNGNIQALDLPFKWCQIE